MIYQQPVLSPWVIAFISPSPLPPHVQLSPIPIDARLTLGFQRTDLETRI